MNETKILQGGSAEVEKQINKLKLTNSVIIQGMTSSSYEKRVASDSIVNIITIIVIVELFPIPKS